jgi:pentafunctional AROM polypeptide
MNIRPIGPLVVALREQGAVIEYAGKDGCPPLRCSAGISPYRDSRGSYPAPAPGAGAEAGTYVPRRRLILLEAKVSSQYVSSVLMAAPYFPPVLVPAGDPSLAADSSSSTSSSSSSLPDPTGGDAAYTELRLAEENPTSLPYITMTLLAMKDFGDNVIRLADNRYLIPRVQYVAPGEYEVEADASSASYPAAVAAVTGRTVILDGVGSTSVQGDATFPLLLRSMGCTVVQEPRRTLVTGPRGGASSVLASGLVGVDVNMAEQTDCFMTLAAVAALATGTTRITGIENQRVKECNRIAAMVAEFAKCGVVARELPDGLEIEGSGLLGTGADAGDKSGARKPPHGAVLHCYDDHRIAMSFAVFGLAVPGVVLDDAACVEKTFPEFWDAIERPLGYTALAADAGAGAHGDASPASTSPAASPASATRPIVLIGMRGAGKSSLAVAAAAELGPSWAAVDLDRELEAVATARNGSPQTVADVIAREGWPGFRALEVEILRGALGGASGAGGRILACGGGVVETEDGRNLLKAHIQAGGVVIEVRRDIDDIAVDLGQPTTAQLANAASTASGDAAATSGRPAYAGGASLQEVFSRRRAWYESCSSSIFVVPAGERDWSSVDASFASFVGRVARIVGGATPAKPSAGFSWPAAAHDADASAAVAPLGQADGTGFVCFAVPDLRGLASSSATSSASTSSTSYPHSLVVPAGAEFDALAGRVYAIASDASAVELRVDCLASQEPDFVLFQLALLRACLRRGALRALETNPAPGCVRRMPRAPHKPVIFTVRSTKEGGKFAGTESAYAALTTLGIRAGCEFVDIEAGRDGWAPAAVGTLAAAAHAAGAKVIGSAHWPVAPPPSTSELVAAARAARRHGSADVVKLVVSAASPDHAFALQASAAAVREAVLAGSGAASKIDFIFLAMGEAGKLSRVANDFLTPVTHSLLPTAAAPGQLSLRQVRALRADLGIIRARSYFLFGSPVEQSVSPGLQNAGFSALGLPHRYGLVNTTDAKMVEAIVRGTARPVTSAPLEGRANPEAWAADTFPSFVGGGNVTIPLKQDVLPLCDVLSPAAKEIGAVNVLAALPKPNGQGITLYGDNTDWLGVYWPLKDRLRARAGAASVVVAGSSSSSSAKPCLVCIGAGGTSAAVAYAAKQLGLHLVVQNRTVEKAQELAAKYGGTAVSELTESSLPGPVAALVSTLPHSVAWTAPEWLLSRDRPVVFDVAYRPRSTPLLAQARDNGCAVVEGVEMLIGQGVAAFSVWVGQGQTRGTGEGAALEPGPGVPVAEMARKVYQLLEAQPGL